MVNAGHGQEYIEKSNSRKLLKENTKIESSFRVLYYGGASGAVPFMWESQPGTPKHKFSDNSLPPLTPPPSYQFSPNSNSIKKNFNRNSKPAFLRTILKLGWKNSHVTPSFSSSSSSGSSTYSSTLVIGQRRKSPSLVRSRSAVQYYIGEDKEQEESFSCFGNARDDDGSGRVHGGKGKKNVKKVLLGILGQGRS